VRLRPDLENMRQLLEKLEQSSRAK
jgi:hypothetical protein